MSVDWSRLHSVTTRELINALLRDGSTSVGKPAATAATSTPMAGGSQCLSTATALLSAGAFSAI